MHSPAAILLRLALSVLATVATLVYLAVLHVLGHDVPWTAVLSIVVIAAMMQPPLHEVRAIIREVEAQIKHMAGDD